MRTKKSIFNFLVAFLSWVILSALGFFRVSYFIDIYGSEMNGLVQLIMQIFAYLGLMEMGFGAAMNFRLYKPLAEKKFDDASELFCGAREIFKKIARNIFSLGLLVAIVLPFIIKYESINGIYISLIFLLYSIDYLVQYLYGLPYNILISADQKNYKANIIISIKNVLFRSLEIFLILSGVNYLLVLVVGIIASFIANSFVIKMVRKYYPWLNENAEKDMSTKKMTKDVIVHKLSGVIFNKTDPIVLSMTQGLVATSIYSAYSYIFNSLGRFVGYIFQGAKDSFGNFLEVTSDDKNKLKVFNQFNSLAFFIGIIFTITFSLSVNNFVGIWIDESYMLDIILIYIFSANLFQHIIIKPLLVVRNARGLYKETRGYTLFKAATNLILSVGLSLIWGMKGIILATLISHLFVSLPFEVKMVYKNILKEKIYKYYVNYIISIVLVFILYIANIYLINHLDLYNNLILSSWIVQTGSLFMLNTIVVFIIYYIFSEAFRELLKRLVKVIRRRGN